MSSDFSWINYNVVDGLRELSDYAYQSRVWTGQSQAEVSSFDEAICVLFDTGQLTRNMERSVLGTKYTELFRKLDEGVTVVQDADHPPDEVHACPEMNVVREVAADILASLSTDGVDLSEFTCD